MLVDLVMQRTGFSEGPVGALAKNVALLPAKERFAAWATVTRAGKSPGISRLLPEWTHPRLAGYRDWMLRRSE